MRWTRSCALVVGACIALLLLKLLIISPHPPHVPPRARTDTTSDWKVSHTLHVPLAARPTPPSTSHPIHMLHSNAVNKFESVLSSQSKSLNGAVQEYKRRYGIPPPPRFDAWYKFATSRGVQLVDEFDTIYDSLLPFWAMEPVSIRSRVREALGYEPNGLIALQIRGGGIARLGGGPKWQLDELGELIKSFVRYLPDMDIAFNLHDEPRVVVPHDELSKMVRIAKTQTIPLAISNPKPKNDFSARPADVDDAQRRLKVSAATRFNEYQHQPTWVPSRLSCSPDSPARDFRDNATDCTAGYALGELGFVYNQTAFSDICSSPSLRNNFGFFQRPNAFKITHELVPVFSQSKLSSFQDILYPSPWYHYRKVVTDQPMDTHELQYDESRDMEWEAKNITFWWRGSTTGGFSREGGWRHQHRQTFVRNINAKDLTHVLVDHGSTDQHNWQRAQVPREEYNDYIDIHFSGVGQCDPGDCDAQREYFDVTKPVDSQEAWKYRFLLDIDGNAFSGRFYSFLRSNSLPLKLSIFREWHQDWLTPWVHFVPLSLHGEEHLETVRYLAADEEGVEIASRMALGGRDWANKALRNEDMEVWFFRLLLEYGRVIDDDRLSIGFAG